jgi:hypothetical protein
MITVSRVCFLEYTFSLCCRLIQANWLAGQARSGTHWRWANKDVRRDAVYGDVARLVSSYHAKHLFVLSMIMLVPRHHCLLLVSSLSQL